ncbi:MAG: DUF3568 family protein [Phycisphaerales bacterium JB043]
MNRSRIPLLIIIASMPLSLSGCVVAVAAAGTGAYLYATSDHEGLVEMTLEQARTRVPQAMKSNEIVVSDWEHNEASGFVRGVHDVDTNVRVDYSYDSETTTRVKIRVGAYGNADLELAIFKSLQEGT